MPKSCYRRFDKERVAPEDNPESSGETYRSPWRRDYARLIHCPTFRRLQGKTQLFPGEESDFFRNRLTHSLEVAQIAKSIAIRLNATEPPLAKRPIDTDLVETCALAHDIGHPPFGHNGEEALDECMRAHGGFEGNAQTLRILSVLEKRGRRDPSLPPIVRDPIIGEIEDQRCGLNLTYRTLAGVLKYDHPIPENRKAHDGVVKGYYKDQQALVAGIKQKVCDDAGRCAFKTVECSIMDIADDIAYSTYDLEDAFKAGFLTPLDMISVDDALLERIAVKISRRAQQAGKAIKLSARDVRGELIEAFSHLFDLEAEQHEHLAALYEDGARTLHAALLAAQIKRTSDALAQDSYRRTEVTSRFVGQFIRGIQYHDDRDRPALSKVSLDDPTFRRVEALKNFTYEKLIMSSRLKVAEHRGKAIVRELFDTLDRDGGHLLLPDDYRRLHEVVKDDAKQKKRLICDFIAGMTDRYAIELYGRLFSSNPESIWKPL